jgi:flavodoxin
VQKLRILLVYYSRTGVTTLVATRICRALEERGFECALEPLAERRSRAGIFGYLRSGRDSIFDRSAQIEPLIRDPARYDVVIVGTPIWNTSPSTPVRAFLRQNGSHLNKVAFFVTYGGMGRERALSSLSRLSGKTPIAELGVRQRDVERDEYDDRVQEFVATITAYVERFRSRSGGFHVHG